MISKASIIRAVVGVAPVVLIGLVAAKVVYSAGHSPVRMPVIVHAVATPMVVATVETASADASSETVSKARLPIIVSVRPPPSSQAKP